MKSISKPVPEALLSILIIIGSAIIAIIMHAVLPAKVDESLFDGWLVAKYGFAATAIAYFLILFTHCTAVLMLNRNRLICTNNKSAINFGLSFSLIYMIGMQEIVLSSSPYTEWGSAFIRYQLMMGIGDAIPVIVLCLLIGNLFFRGQNTYSSFKRKETIPTLLSFILLVGTIRLIGSYSGAVKSEFFNYPIPVAIWGYILGLVFGIVYMLVERTTLSHIKTMLLGLGINWMIFNSFIGLIRKDAMADALLRSIIDLTSIFLAIRLSLIINKRLLEKS